MYSEDEVWAAITDQAHQDETLNKSLSVQEISQSWLKRDRLPIITVTRNYDKNTLVLMQVHSTTQLDLWNHGIFSVSLFLAIFVKYFAF